MSIFSFFNRKPRIDRPKIIMTILVRDEADIIEQHLLYHADMDIDGFIVTDNRSLDGTHDILEEYKKNGMILELINEPSARYNQVAWVHRMIELARDKYGADYCINSDADEFWYTANRSLRNELASSRASNIYCPSYMMLPTSSGEFWNATDCVKRAAPKKFGLNGHNNLLFGKPTKKVIHRTQGYQMIKMGNHGVEMTDDIYERSRKIWIYHYSIRSKEQFKRKMLQGGAAIEANETSSQKEASHWRYFYRGYNAGTIDLDQEYYNVIGAGQLMELRRVGCVVTDVMIKNIFLESRELLSIHKSDS
jgi:hypothetical protein